MESQDLAGYVRNARSRLILPRKPVLTETGKQKTCVPWSRLADCRQTQFIWATFEGREDTSPVTLAHGSFQSKKELRSKLHKLIPVDRTIQHSYSQRHRDLLIPDVGSSLWNPQQSGHRPPRSWWHTAELSQLCLAGQWHMDTQLHTHIGNTEGSNCAHLESGIRTEMNKVTGAELMKA